jgi:peroxiredoxin
MLRLLLFTSAALVAEPVKVPAPDISIRMENGQTVKLSALKGKPVMIEVFSTTCPACQAMTTVVEKTYRNLGPKGLQVIAVINDDAQRADAPRFRKEYGITYQIGFISREDSYKLFGLSIMRPFSYPATAFIDSTGTIRDRHTGLMDLDAVAKSLAPVLRSAAPQR